MGLRWSEEEYRAHLQRQLDYEGMYLGSPNGYAGLASEKAFQSAVVRLAKQYGWLAYHTFDSRRSPSGFPDLVLAPGPTCHNDPRLCYAVELKTETGQVTLAQQAWLEALAGCTGVVAEVWRPSQLQEIIERLRREENARGSR